ncbi:hypothetical protein ACTWP5_19185 [Streptomyces sp. 4N509B]|uniref:hypothetical protein n=1 Tax=Streptomyces sp. 4N509B TaxID=3457413 RepID=UPI003FD2A475
MTATRPVTTGPALRRAARTCLAGLLLAGTALGCGGGSEEETNGMEDLSADEIEERAREAAGRARTVLLTGTVISGDASYRIDMRLGENGGTGEVSADGGTTFELLRIDEELFLRADEAFWQAEELPAELESDPAKKLDDMYVAVAPDDPAYEELSGFTDKNVLLDGLLTLQGERETGDRSEVGGVRTIRVEADGGAGGVMEVALVGRPYPLRLERGGNAGQVTLSEWNEDFPLNPPVEEQIVDYGEDMITEGDGDGE